MNYQDLSSLKIKISKNALLQKQGDEAVILNLDNERYYGLNKTGVHFWELLCEHQNLETVMSLMLKTFEVDESRLNKDILELIEDLSENNLIPLLS